MEWKKGSTGRPEMARAAEGSSSSSSPSAPLTAPINTTQRDSLCIFYTHTHMKEGRTEEERGRVGGFYSLKTKN